MYIHIYIYIYMCVCVCYVLLYLAPGLTIPNDKYISSMGFNGWLNHQSD